MSDLATPMTEFATLPEPKIGVRRVAMGLLIAGLVLCGFALSDEGNRLRFAFAYVGAFICLWGIVLGSLFFVGLQHLTHAVWSVVIRRVAEAFAAPMILVAVMFVPILLFAIMPDHFQVFPWANAETVKADHLLAGKQAYLNVSFFAIRAAGFFALWIMFSRFFVGTSLAQDRGVGGVEATVAMRKWSAPFTLIFAVTATLAGIDWVMSLSPNWFSTIFGVYVFSGMVLASLAVITMVTVKMGESGRLPLNVVTDQHLYSLGALLFAFTCFWAYIAFSQYMLIWYANMPEETFYLHARLQGGWLGVSVALAVVRFVLPFLMLLSRRAKMNRKILFWASVLILGGQFLDLYWLVMPEVHRERPLLGWQEFGPALLVIGVLILASARFLGRHAPIAVGDPSLEESRRFHL